MNDKTSAYFLSDAHLGAGYIPDQKKAERRLVHFLDSIKNNATHIFLLGDILDYWFEYRDVVPKGHTRFFGKLAELSDNGIHIEWLTGNHDIWMFGYFEDELGINVHDGSKVISLNNKHFFLNHGDTVGWRPRKFRFIQSLFRNKVCQKLFSAIHPRWTVRFALNWSKHNRELHPDANNLDPDTNTLVSFSKEYLENHPDIDYFIYGHLHILAQTSITEKQKSAIITFLGEWINTFSYAHFDGKNLSLHKFSDF
ncbi:MAG: UDP-2,3-diacylglucosamine diphosphatase [Prevotella sp.]|nr:UDP-2,3-diacylglucosamine diphosphatase [Bacteroides sp.]MCM1366310.1 UDP-2,3-diacylglucosamine diphosphatase [Prevotella sp.]MCM1437114.1 UDP-2,3-diacylglucosamine diphosphatase [Prevotella sp.]